MGEENKSARPPPTPQPPRPLARTSSEEAEQQRPFQRVRVVAAVGRIARVTKSGRHSSVRGKFSPGVHRKTNSTAITVVSLVKVFLMQLHV